MKTIDFYYSIGSRYSYLASTQIETLEQEFDCQVLWHPVIQISIAIAHHSQTSLSNVCESRTLFRN